MVSDQARFVVQTAHWPSGWRAAVNRDFFIAISMSTGMDNDGRTQRVAKLLRSQDFWAKTTRENGCEIPGISVRDHCLNVGCVAEALIAALPPSVRALLPPGAATLAAMHDVGKTCPGFQAKCDAWIHKYRLVQDAITGR